MKNLIILLGTSLGCLTSPVLFANSNSDATNAVEKQDIKMKHGKNGQDGEDGQNGGNGGKGGDGGANWWQGGNGGNGGRKEDSLTDAATKQPPEQINRHLA